MLKGDEIRLLFIQDIDMQWFEYPNIDPVIFSIGIFKIRWYALAYVVGILLAVYYAKSLVKKHHYWQQTPPPITPKQVDDFMLFAVIGIILGGRLGYCLFYYGTYYLSNPLEILFIWQGGMSFHGGLLGLLITVIFYSKSQKFSFWHLLDITTASAPIGLFLGRIANFINGELYGRITDHPIGIIFPDGGELPRHPSQLYEAALEGIVLFIVLFILIRYKDALKYKGLISGCFGIGYGLSRIAVEFFREPDTDIGFLFGGVTMGMLLSIPMVIIGLLIILKARNNAL